MQIYDDASIESVRLIMESHDNYPPALRLQTALIDILKQAEIIDTHNMDAHGVTVSQGYSLLAFPSEQSITMSDLSKVMNLANSTMTRVVDQLVKKGLVERTFSEKDRRVVVAQLTAIGRNCRAQIEADFRLFFDMVLEEIGADAHETVIESLEMLAQAVVAVMIRKHGEGYENL